MTKKIDHAKTKIFGILAGIFLVTGLGSSILTTVIAYPTPDHRRVAAEFAEINNRFLSDPSADIVTSPEYQRLSDHPNIKYSDQVNNIGGVVSLLIWVATIIFGYRYIRKYRLVSHPIRTIVLAEAVAVVLTIIPTELFMRSYAGITSPFASDAFSMTIMIISATLISALLTWIIAKVTEWQYNRSHGFIED